MLQIGSLVLLLAMAPQVPGAATQDAAPRKDPQPQKQEVSQPDLPRHLWVNPHNIQRFEQMIPLPKKKRELIEPEKVGLPKDFRQPCVKDPILFQCPCCGFGMSTQVLYKYLPSCPKDGCVMPEVDKWEKLK